jgi:hypothetical protein
VAITYRDDPCSAVVARIFEWYACKAMKAKFVQKSTLTIVVRDSNGIVLTTETYTATHLL